MYLKALFCFFALLFSPCYSSTINKQIYTYNPHSDMALHGKVQNVAYGNAGWSYETNNRPNSAERALRLFSEDIEGKDIIDFGCNQGGVLFACKQLGAQTIYGVDYNGWCIDQAKSLAKQLKINDAHFFVGDLENKVTYLSLPEADTTFLFAILDTSSFANKNSIFSAVCRKTKHAFYYEGHQTKHTQVPRMYDILVWTDFTRIEYLGRFDGRILIRASREMISMNEIPSGAITSSHSQEQQLNSEEVYVLPGGPNPCFSSKCRLIQFVKH